MNDDKYVFIVEWFDSAAALVRTYNLTFYLQDSTIDMVTHNKMTVWFEEQTNLFKKMRIPGCSTQRYIHWSHLSHILKAAKGNWFCWPVYQRQIRKTKRKVLILQLRTLAVIKPDAYMSMGKIINMIEESGFIINNVKIAKISEQ